MNKSKEIKALLANMAAKEVEARELSNKSDAKADEIMAKVDEVKAIKAKIEAQKMLDEGKNFDEDGDLVKDIKPVNAPIYAEPKNHKGPFNSFGEQMLAIVKSSSKGAAIDNRLLTIQNAALGANEGVPSEGGFLVQTDFSNELLKTIFETGILAPKCRKIPISAGANSVKINGVDETSRANGSRWGGVQGYWASEAATVTATKPKFRQIELSLRKLMALYYATDELLQDASALDSVLTQAFSEELRFKLDDAIFRGTGAGQPLGFINSGCLVTVAAEANQPADTIVAENVIKMWSRMLAQSRANAVWLINQEIEPELYTMAVSTGASGIPVYMPANGLSGQPYGTLFGRPVIPIEHSSAIGDVGDISLVDLSQYLLADKGGVQFASSMHVQFITDEMAFRVTYRVDGQPMAASPVTPFKGAAGNTRSSFVTLAAR